MRVLFVQAAWVVLIKPKSWERHGLKPWIEAAKKRCRPSCEGILLQKLDCFSGWLITELIRRTTISET
jgi:hypothetical protein